MVGAWRTTCLRSFWRSTFASCHCEIRRVAPTRACINCSTTSTCSTRTTTCDPSSRKSAICSTHGAWRPSAPKVAPSATERRLTLSRYHSNRTTPTSCRGGGGGGGDAPVRRSQAGVDEAGEKEEEEAEEKGASSVGPFVLSVSKPSREHLTPEVSLRLMRPSCGLWSAPAEQALAVLEERGIAEPFWAFYWPGGQVLTRYLLDNPQAVGDKSVLDVGSGCGASAIAAAMGGARSVLANDIDPAAIHAIKLNAAANDVAVETTSDNLIGCADSQWDVALLGDMFYDRSFTDAVVDWLSRLAADGTEVLIGDPGRLALQEHSVRRRLIKVFEAELPPRCREENNGMTHGFVWRLPASQK